MFIAIPRNSQILCKATTDISGDIPESAGGMNQYEKVIETLTTLFPVWVSLTIFFFHILSQFFLTSYLVSSLKVDWLTWAGHLGSCCGHLQANCGNYCLFQQFTWLSRNMFINHCDVMALFQVTWLETDLFTLGLGFLMLSMGLTLTFEDFRRCLRNPWTVRDNHWDKKENLSVLFSFLRLFILFLQVGVGFLAQYLIKPMLGFAIAMVFFLIISWAISRLESHCFIQISSWNVLCPFIYIIS